MSERRNGTVLVKETEIQTRNRVVRRHLQDADNCIVLKIDTKIDKESELSPFGFHFELDQKRYEAKKKRLRREKIFKWLSWVAYYHHKFGIRHLILVSMLIGYVLAGGAMFLSIESPYEMTDLKETIILMNGIIGETTLDVINLTLTYDGTIREEKIARLLKRYYKTMLEAEGRFHGSVWHKSENLEMNLMWYFSSSTFYCMTLFSTIGYGTIACQTSLGQALSVVYASIGIPLMLVVLGDVGEWFQKLLTKCYIYFLFKYKIWRNKPLPDTIDDIFLPMWIALPLVAIYLLLSSTFILLFDHSEGKLPGIGFGDAFYFTFISLTTIGLGDVMPYNIQYSPILAALFLLGLALISIVNTSIYAQLYDGFFNGVEAMEAQLDRIHKFTHRPQGSKVFQDLEPAILMLVCSFPHLGNQVRDGALDGILKPAGHHEKGDKKEKKVTYSNVVRKRTISYSGDAEHKSSGGPRNRAPTLGAMGGRDLAKFRKQRQSNRRLSDEKPSADSLSKRRGSTPFDFASSSNLPDWLLSMKKDVEKKKQAAIEATAQAELKRSRATPLPQIDNFDDLYGDAPCTSTSPTAPEPTPPEPTTQGTAAASEVPVISEGSPSDSPGAILQVPQSPPLQIPKNIHLQIPQPMHLEVPRPSREEYHDEFVVINELPPDELVPRIAAPSQSSTEEEEEVEPTNRPPPLIVLPDTDGGSDEDDEDEEDDWVPTGKFANLGKRGSVFVPHGQLDDSEGPGPSVEYIP